MPALPHPTRGADHLVQALQRAGVRCVFSLSGNHIMAVYDALIGSGLRLIHTRHESAAVHMADAWARLTGEVGVALVTGGPGHAHAMSALYTAQMAESPVLLLSGHAPRAQLGRGAFQEMQQAEMAAPVCKAAWTCAGADAVAADLARAVQLARSGRPGPVHLSLPSDALEGPVGAAGPAADAFVPSALPLSDDDAGRCIAWLRQARRPLVLGGPQLLTRRGRHSAGALQAACGVPVIGMESPRGVNDPSLGAFAEVLADADAVLLLGKRLDFTLQFGQSPLSASLRYAQVDSEALELDRTRRAVGQRLEMGTVADTDSALGALLRAAVPTADHGWSQAVREALDWRPPTWADARASRPDRLHPVQMLRPLQDLLDRHPDALLVADGGEIGQWAQAVLRAPQRLINGVAGSIGSALPYAVAARCVLPDEVPVVAVMGDGSFGFHLSEIDTAARYGLPLVAVVGNDARWNAEMQIQLRQYGPDRLIGCELAPTRYDRVSQALGGHGELVEHPEAMAAAAQRAADCRRPACLNVMIEGLPAPQLRRGGAP